MIKVGDYVIMKPKYNVNFLTTFNNQIGIVKSIELSYVFIEFINYVDGHDSLSFDESKKGKNGHCWFFTVNSTDFEKILTNYK